VSDVVGYSRLTGADEDRILARLRALRSDLIDPTIAVHHGRVVKRTGDGAIAEFRSVVDAVNCAIEVQKAMVERNAGVPEDRRIEFRVGIHVGDVVEESDGDLMGEGVNIAARLEGIAKPGAICLSEHAYWQVKGRLDLKVSDLGPTQLKNIAEPIRVYSLKVDQSPQPTPALAAPVPEKSGTPRLSLVVLPFANIGHDPEQDHFVDGVTECLTTDLSRISGAFVIGRSTAFTYRGKAVDLKQLGRDLNVRYVLEGSVQRVGNRMRVNVQLIEAATGGHLWAERFDKLVADFFELQDEIVSRLANRLGHELALAEARLAERAINPDSMDHYFLGLANLRKGITAEHQHKARCHFERSLDLEPDNVDALVMRAWVDLTVAIHLPFEDRPERFRSAEADLGKALRLRPETADAHVALGLLRLQMSRVDQGIAEFERALAIDRNHPHAHALIGVGKTRTGRYEETEAHVLEALRISPHDRRAGMWLMIAAAAKLWAGHYEAAVARLSRSIELDSNEPMRHFYFAAASALLGRVDEAREAARAGLKLNPGFTIAWDRAATPSDHPVFLASRERVHEGMRLAGVPEG
jgi:TolB-like protein/class 3 adenylate cyclase/Flp pilus assembly protein TadD